MESLYVTAPPTTNGKPLHLFEEEEKHLADEDNDDGVGSFSRGPLNSHKMVVIFCCEISNSQGPPQLIGLE